MAVLACWEGWGRSLQDSRSGGPEWEQFRRHVRESSHRTNPAGQSSEGSRRRQMMMMIMIMMITMGARQGQRAEMACVHARQPPLPSALALSPLGRSTPVSMWVHGSWPHLGSAATCRAHQLLDTWVVGDLDGNPQVVRGLTVDDGRERHAHVDGRAWLNHALGWLHLRTGIQESARGARPGRSDVSKARCVEEQHGQGTAPGPCEPCEPCTL